MQNTGLRHQRKLRELEEGNHATYVTRTDFLVSSSPAGTVGGDGGG